MSHRVLCALSLALLGLAPAVLAEERVRPRRPSRPPRPASCDDPIQGVWVAQRWVARSSGWRQFALTIRRSSPGSADLIGAITNHAWSGAPGDPRFPRCEGGALDTVVEQPAVGTFDGERLDFQGTGWHTLETRCSGWSVYHLDHFRGTLDRARRALRTTNNDQHVDLDEPFVFTRVRCL